MKYFDTLNIVPNIDSNGNIYLLKNLMQRGVLQQDLYNNPMLMYQYTIQEGDTPESIAYKYYGDQYRYWIVLLANNILDPQFDWPLSSQQFTNYLYQKYNVTNISTLTGTVHHYEKTISTVNDISFTTAQKTITIDKEEYDSLVETSVNYPMNDGSTVKQTITKKAISIFDYETSVNEDKRNINLIKAEYADAVEKSLKSIMSS